MGKSIRANWREKKWHKVKQALKYVLENAKAKLVWDFEIGLRKSATSRRPQTWYLRTKKKIWVCEMACPQQVNIKAKRNEKHTKYRQLALELREKTLVVGALVGGIKDVLREVARVFSEVPKTEPAITMTVVEMQETVLIGSDTII